MYFITLTFNIERNDCTFWKLSTLKLKLKVWIWQNKTCIQMQICDKTKCCRCYCVEKIIIFVHKISEIDFVFLIKSKFFPKDLTHSCLWHKWKERSVIGNTLKCFYFWCCHSFISSILCYFSFLFLIIQLLNNYFMSNYKIITHLNGHGYPYAPTPQ